MGGRFFWQLSISSALPILKRSGVEWHIKEGAQRWTSTGGKYITNRSKAYTSGVS